ncbi:hypothetical protein VQ03_03905 [Methylobacterium tarhaniae]|uniref:Uncharacterized protein n=1 Tax=Methylobacterium tarhaniae TaxID=1187852 RepID=A0A0J6TF21_9HYPH|nr:hypothetical protein VQ03_03905 [Methylobacterium tarhaniae]
MAVHGRRREAVGNDESRIVIPRHKLGVSRRVELAAEVGAALPEDGRLGSEGGGEAVVSKGA